MRLVGNIVQIRRSAGRLDTKITSVRRMTASVEEFVRRVNRRGHNIA